MHIYPPATLGVVCHGNILRSQVLSTYLRAGIAARQLTWHIYDAGVCEDPATDFRDAPALLQQVEAELHARGLHVELQQTTWSVQVATELCRCALILAADDPVQQALQQRLPATHPPIYGFYDLLGEAQRTFPDTYDYQRHRQRPDAFTASFDELARIATQLLDLLPDVLGPQSRE